MEVKLCEKNHCYDADLYSSCPVCAAEAGQGGMDPIGATMPLQGNGHDDLGSMNMGFNYAGIQGSASGGMDPIGPTEPIDYSRSGEDAGGRYSEIGTTVPAEKNGFITDDFVGPGRNFDQKATPSKVQQYDDPTKPIDEGNIPGFRPVVGWLVCIDGADKGTDYRIRSGYNYIGRGDQMDICIRNDMHISHEKEAFIGYDPKGKMFFFGMADGKNILYINKKTVMHAVELNPYDVLTVGTTELMFVPLCGERFDWNAYE